MKNIVLFGAGINRFEAIEFYEKDNICFFVDNSPEKQGDYVDGIIIISFEEFLERYDSDFHRVIITPMERCASMVCQLIDAGIEKYEFFTNKRHRFYIKSQLRDEKEYREYNDVLDELVKKTKSIDLINDVESFLPIVNEVKKLINPKDGIIKRKGIIGYESNHYGNAKTLLKYADIDLDDYVYLPITTHNQLAPLPANDYCYRHSVITGGNYYINTIHRYFPYVPVYPVGPYINYVEGKLSKQEVEKIKNGKKIMLAFFNHSTETTEIKDDFVRFIKIVESKYKNDYDEIWYSIYFLDIDERFIDYTNNHNIHLVCSGLRFDDEFNSRFKSILEIVDAICVTTHSTAVPYALTMNKPVACIEYEYMDDQYELTIEEDYNYTDILRTYGQDFAKAFNDIPQNTELQRNLLNPYSGFEYFRTREEIKTIVEISKDMWKRAEGDANNLPIVIKEIYREYVSNNLDLKKHMIEEAVGDYLYN